MFSSFICISNESDGHIITTCAFEFLISVFVIWNISLFFPHLSIPNFVGAWFQSHLKRHPRQVHITLCRPFPSSVRELLSWRESLQPRHGPSLCLPADKEMQIQSILQLDCCHTNVAAARDSSPLPTLHSALRKTAFIFTASFFALSFTVTQINLRLIRPGPAWRCHFYRSWQLFLFVHYCYAIWRHYTYTCHWSWSFIHTLSPRFRQVFVIPNGFSPNGNNLNKDSKSFICERKI